MSEPPAAPRHLFGEVTRFLATGGVATLVSVVGFNVLAHGFLVGGAPLGNLPLVAFIAANLVAGVVAYLGLRMWAFAHVDTRDPVSGLPRFFVLAGVTMTIPLLCLWFSRYALDLTSPWADNASANVVGLSLGTAARFWLFRRFVFDTVAVPAPGPEVHEG